MSNFKQINLTHHDAATGIDTIIGLKVPDQIAAVTTDMVVTGIEVVDRSTLRLIPSKVWSADMDRTLLQMKTRGFKMKTIAEKIGMKATACYSRYYLLVSHKGVKHSSHHHKPTRLNTRVSKAAADLIRDYSNASGMSINHALDSILKSTMVKDYVESHPSVIAYRESQERKLKRVPVENTVTSRVIKLRGFEERFREL